MTARPVVATTRADFAKSLLWGAISGWVLVFLPYILTLIVRRGAGFLGSDAPEWPYISSLILILPLLQGAVAGLVRGREGRSTGSGIAIFTLIAVIDIGIGAFFLREGVICLIMASPFLWVMLGAGYGIGRLLIRLRKSRSVSVSLIPFIVLGVIAETQGPAPDYHQVIVDEVTVNAPPEYIWRYVVDYPDNPNKADYWLWQVGLPAPTHSVAPVQKVGERRECRFTGDKAFVERISELEPNKKLTFVITEQPQHPEIIGHINVDKGQIELRANADGTTTLIATSWYRLHVRPAAYFDLWAADVTRHIHFRVLGYMKELAERDYAAGKSVHKAT